MEKSRSKVVPVLSGLSVLAVAVANASFAQAQGERATGGLEEVVVTARKREESAQDVPVLVKAISAEQIRDMDLTSLEKLASTTPNFNIGRASNGSGAQITMRGIGSSSTSIGIEQSVAVIVDGAYYGQGRVIQEGFFDLQGAEILKGPQALFFGKNATAGVVSFTSADPGEETEGLVRVSHEFKAATTQVEGIYSTPVTDTFGVRLALRYTDMADGYYDNVSQNPVPYSTFDVATGAVNTQMTQPFTSDQPAEEELLARLTLKWTPSDDMTATLKYTHDENEVYNSSWNYQCWASPSGSTSLALDENGNGYACDGGFETMQGNMPANIAANFPNAKSDGRMYNEYESDAVNLNLVWDLDGLSVNWVNNWQENENDWACNCDYQISPISVFATENSSWEAFSSELRILTSSDGPFNAMVGALYQETTRDFNQWIAFANVENSAASPSQRYIATSKKSTTDGETFSVFGQLIWSISETLEATVGGRYTDETKDSMFKQPYNNPAVTAIFRPAEDPLGVVTADQTFTNFSPEATLTWKPQDDLMFYAAYKTGYKSGGFSNSGINSGFSANPKDDLTFNEEEAEGFEVGVKSTLMENQLRLNATAYSYEYTDLQVDFFRSDIFAFNTVTADATVQGYEFEVEFAPNAIAGLTVFGLLNYNQSEYDNSVAPCYAGQTPDMGCNLSVNNSPFQNVDGAPTAVSPEWTGVFGGRFNRDLSSDLYLSMAASARYSDEYLASGFNNPLSKVDSYWYVDANVRLGSYGSGWELALIGKNLTDESYVTGVVDGPSTGGGTATPDGVLADQLGFGNIPRTVAVEATYRF